MIVGSRDRFPHDNDYVSRYPSPRNGPSSSDTDDRSSTCSSLNRRTLKPPAYAFILPNLEQFPDDFRRFLERDMIEIPTLRRLEASGHLNWWCQQNSSQRLWPLVTTGDGNCLLHAASLGIWGVHDRQLNLRQLLHEVLTSGERRHAFYRRWRWHESKSNLQSELVLSEEEWKKEWDSVLEMAAPTPRVVSDTNSSSNTTNEQIYESLECIHVFALAQVLKRPIIIVADTVLRNANGEELAPIPFGGIYLPLEIPSQQCHRSPLVLCYDSSHFSALVAMRQTSANCLPAVPITDRNRNLLPVHFSVDPGLEFTWWKDAEDQRIANELDAAQSDDRRLELIGTYMDIVKMDLRRGSVKKTMPVTNGSELSPSTPIKLLTIAAAGQPENGHASRLFTEIRQHFRWLSRRSKRKRARPVFSASELRQSNCVLTVLLHNYAHQYMDSMVNNYIVGAKERFERAKISSSVIPKNRMSRSFSSSSVLLTCLNTHCNKSASPSTNFLCSICFEDQKREMASIGSSNPSPNSVASMKPDIPTKPKSPPTPRECPKSPTMPLLSAATIHRPYRKDESAIRYADESASASSTVSSRYDGRGAVRDVFSHRKLPSSTSPMNSYFYEDEAELAARIHHSHLDDGIKTYRRSGGDHHMGIPTHRPNPTLPRVISPYRNGYLSTSPSHADRNFSNSCAVSNGIGRKVSSGGVTFYYATPSS